MTVGHVWQLYEHQLTLNQEKFAIAFFSVRFANAYIVKNIRRIYGRIAGNQLPGHVPLFFTGTRKNYLAWQDRKEQGSVTYGSVAI